MVGLVECPVDASGRSGGLGEREAFELRGERVDVTLKVPGLDGVAGPGERRLLRRGQDACVNGSLVRGARRVVAFDDLRADTLT